MSRCPHCRSPVTAPAESCEVCGGHVQVLDRPLVGEHARSLAKLELLVVSLIAFGPPLLRSTAALLAEGGAVVVDDGGLIAGLIEELVVLGVVGGLLVLRGWRLPDFRLDVGWRLTGFGLALAVVWWGLEGLLLPWLPGQDVPWDASGLSVPAALAFSLVNGAWEELLLVGYLFRAAERLGSTRTALALSVLVRVAYHLYQGLGGALVLAIMGLVLGLAYLRWRRLWPLIVVHVLADAYGLLWLVAWSEATG